MKYELILITDSDDQRKVEGITDFDELKRLGKEINSFQHYIFNTKAERKTFIWGVHSMGEVKNNYGIYMQKDTESQKFRYTWRHEVYIDAIDKDQAKEIWGSLDLGELNKHQDNGDIEYHEFIEVHSMEDEDCNDLLNQ